MGEDARPGDEGWAETLALADGVRVRMREITASDRAKLHEAFDELSPESRYWRFMSPKSRLTERELTYLTQLDGQRHFAVGAARLEPDGSEGDGIGIARAIRLADTPDAAEIAMTVSDAFQGQGLGTTLLDRLATIAARRGIERFVGEVLSSNTRILQVLRAWGPAAKIEHDGTVTHVELSLDGRGDP